MEEEIVLAVERHTGLVVQTAVTEEVVVVVRKGIAVVMESTACVAEKDETEIGDRAS